VDWLLRRNFWIVRLVGVAIVAALVANTATTLLALRLLSGATGPVTPLADEADEEEGEDAEDAPSPALAAHAPSDERARRAERNAERILGYSPFCPTCGPAPAASPVAADPAMEGAPAPSEAQRTQLPLVVAATMEADDPKRSLATLVDTTHGRSGLFGVGDPLGPSVELVAVATGVVHIRNEGRLEYIPFEGLPPAPAPATKPKAKAKDEAKAAADERSIPGAQEAIQCRTEGDCVVERAFVEQLIASPKLLVGQGGASPATTTDGAPGFRLRGVRKGTLPDLLGLENGDVITEVGGAPLTMDVLPGLYGKLRHASHVEVTVDRKGKRMTRSLEIRS
jgi:general secretion pathway protein C